MVLFPRRRSETPPTFRTHAGGAVIEVAGPWSTDYVLLTDGPDEVRVDDGPALRGPAASVQQRTDRPPLGLTAPMRGA